MTEALIVPSSRSPDTADTNTSPLRDILTAGCDVHSKARRGAREDQIEQRRWRIGFFAFYSAVALTLSGLAMVADRPDVAQTRPLRPVLLLHQ